MVVALVQIVIAVGLSLLAGYLLNKANKNLIQDDKPTSLATRGSYVPVVKGRRRIGHVFGWAGGRATHKEKTGGKNLFGGPKADVFTEDGWHLLCSGPAFALHQIEQGGEVLFKGPITSESHPSGSTIDLGKEGSFRIFWGEDDQPINTYLGDASRVGVSSRWPGWCYIEWRAKRLGTSPMWPLMTYTIETRPTDTILTGSPGYIDATFVLDGTTFNMQSAHNGISGVGYFRLNQDHTAEIRPLDRLQASGDSGLGVDTDFNVLFTEVEEVVTLVDPGDPLADPPIPPQYSTTYFTRIYVSETISGAAGDGTLQLYTNLHDDGWNGAHMLAEWLFGEWPRGAGLDQDEFDMTTFEALGVLLDKDHENLRCSSFAPDGQNLTGVVGGIMQDFGILLPLNMRLGLLQVNPVRQPTGTLPNISDYAMVDRPVIEVAHGPKQIDRLIFSFSDESNQFRDMTISIDDDGQAFYEQFYRARQVQIISSTQFDSCARISERRAFEELAGGNVISIYVGREARTLLPGQQLTIEGFEEVMLLTETQHDPLSGRVTLGITNDFYGAPLSDFITGKANTGGGAQIVQADLIGALVEVPEALLGAGGPQTIVPVCVRAHSSITGHVVHLSQDNSTYTLYGQDLNIFTGGTLLESVDDLYEQATGPTFTALGPDISSVLDLSSDETSWRNGRQLAVFVDTLGRQEICFLKKVTSIGAGVYRLDGLIRARYDTRPLAVGLDDKVFIFQNDDGELVQDVLLEPQTQIFEKHEPLGIGSLSLAQVPLSTALLYGKGVRPVTPSDVFLDTGADADGAGTTNWTSNSYVLAGSSPDDDLILRWGYSTPQSNSTGAGLFGAGDPVFDSDPEGDFLVEILDSLDNILRTELAPAATYTYTRADRLVDFSSVEPASFKVRVTQIRAGYRSDSITATFTNNT